MTATVQLRRFVQEACDGPFGSAIKSEHYADKGARVVRLGNIGAAEWRGGDAAFLDLDYFGDLARHAVEPNDLLIAGLGDDRNPVGRAAVAPKDLGPALVKADCYRLRLRGADPQFVAYCLSSPFGQSQSAQLADGSTRQRLTLGKALSLRIPELPLAEQRAIADYLDAATARIDALIAKKQQLIHLLEERRSSLTFAGVTGRFGRSSGFAPADLAWADELPDHWRSTLLRLVAEQGTGHTPSRDHPEWWIPGECVVPWVTTGEVQQVRSDRLRVLHETRERISHIGIANSSAEIHPKRTVFLCRTAASAGYSGIMGSAMATSQDIATWTCGEQLDPEFLLFCLRAMRKDLLERLATGSTHKTIYMPEIQGLRIPLPPIDEQRAIVSVLKQKIDASFAATDSIASQIGLLTEHRQALITAAVTGEFAVPGAA